MKPVCKSGSVEPGGGFVWNAAEGPCLQGADERFLRGLLGQIKMASAEDTSEGRGDAARLVPEEVIDE